MKGIKHLVSSRGWTWIAGIATGLLIALPLTQSLYSKQDNAYAVIESKFKVMNQILYYVNQLYYDDVDMESLMDGAFSGIMDQLDPHSIFISAKDQKNIDEMFRGEFQGIGIEFDILNGYITVIAPVVGGPSEQAGIQAGDWITKIDGKNAKDIERDEVYKKLRGKKGTRVDLEIGRMAADPFNVTIIRDDIPLYSVRASIMLDEEIGYAWLTRFSKSGPEVKKAINKLLDQGMKKMILDLRNNGGGILEQAAEVANIFIAERDTLVYTKGKSKEMEQVYLAAPQKGNEDFSVIVLINRGSASGSEIVAGAIQDLDRGLIVGETSFGKGLVQRQAGLSAEVVVAKATISWTPRLPKHRSSRGSGNPDGGGGITPDIHIPWELETNKTTREILSHPKRFMFNWSTQYLQDNEVFEDYAAFQSGWSLSKEEVDSFYHYINEEEKFDKEEFEANRTYLKAILKSEVAGVKWGRDELWGVRIFTDNQVMDALNHFNKADKFIE